MIALEAFGKMLRAGFESYQLEEPEYVDTKLKALKRQIESRLDALKATSEKKRELGAEKAKIEKQLQ